MVWCAHQERRWRATGGRKSAGARALSESLVIATACGLTRRLSGGHLVDREYGQSTTASGARQVQYTSGMDAHDGSVAGSGTQDRDTVRDTARYGSSASAAAARAAVVHSGLEAKPWRCVVAWSGMAWRARRGNLSCGRASPSRSKRGRRTFAVVLLASAAMPCKRNERPCVTPCWRWRLTRRRQASGPPS